MSESALKLRSPSLMQGSRLLLPAGAPPPLALPAPVPAVRGRRRGRLQLADIVWTTVLLAACVSWTFTLRPQSLGGPVGYVMLRGVSMVPTYKPGDLVIARPRASYSHGDIVAYRVPEGEVGEGIIIVHRIIGGSESTGFILKGDNNPDPDEWRPKGEDVVGRVWLRIPRLGLVLAFLHAPVPLASLATGIAMAIVLVPSRKARRPSRTKVSTRG